MVNWRWDLFWIRDFIFNKSRIRKAYKDIERIYCSDNKTPEYQISKLLEHARTTTEFYADIPENISIQDFPIINKRTIIENYDNMLSTKCDNEKLHKMSTSGSTGTPFTVVQNKEKRNRVIAEILFFGKICGYEFGEKQVYFRVWVDSIKKLD